MRAHIAWPVTWGVCFVGGMVIGSTRTYPSAFGRARNLRGSEDAGGVAALPVTSEKVLPSMTARLLVNEEETDTEATHGKHAEGSQQNTGKDDKTAEAPSLAHHEESPATTTIRSRGLASSVHRSGGEAYYPSGKFASIKEQNGGLWGPSEEEEAEIARDFAELEGMYLASTEKTFDFVLGYEGESYSYDFDDESYSYEYRY